ncbi:MAG TPA: hypothetical protein VFL75_07965 [Candidatus Limnocylindria bacterium]|jgi:hypothetical protein|nr:hypothetical protein [Candidatus Limnocylindria bacterium]
MRPTSIRRWYGLLVATLSLVALAACGPTQASPAIGGDLAARATSVCETALAAKQAWPEFPVANFDPTHPDASALPQVAHWLEDEVTPTFDAWISDLRALGTPPSGTAEWARLLAAVQAIVDLNAAQAAAAASGDSGKFAATTSELRTSQPELESAAAAAGVPKCADVHKP